MGHGGLDEMQRMCEWAVEGSGHGVSGPWRGRGTFTTCRVCKHEAEILGVGFSDEDDCNVCLPWNVGCSAAVQRPVVVAAHPLRPCPLPRHRIINSEHRNGLIDSMIRE